MSNSGKEGLTQKHLLQFKIAILVPFCLLCALFCVCVLSRFSRVQLFATPWTVAHQAPLSVGFPRQEYWKGLPCSPPGDLPNPGIKPESLMSPALASRFFTTSTTWEAPNKHILILQEAYFNTKSDRKL